MSDKPVKMPGASGLTGIQALRDNLFFAVSQGNSVKLDASKVKKADTATLQVLASLAATVKSKGGTLEWVERSDIIDKHAARMGMSELIGLT